MTDAYVDYHEFLIQYRISVPAHLALTGDEEVFLRVGERRVALGRLSPRQLVRREDPPRLTYQFEHSAKKEGSDIGPERILRLEVGTRHVARGVFRQAPESSTHRHMRRRW